MTVKPAFAPSDPSRNEAKFKLYSMVLTLQKIKVQGQRKGFASEKHLWLYEVNHLAYKVLKSSHAETEEDANEGGRDLVKH